MDENIFRKNFKLNVFKAYLPLQLSQVKKRPQKLRAYNKSFSAFSVWGGSLGRLVGLGWACTLGSAALG